MRLQRVGMLVFLLIALTTAVRIEPLLRQKIRCFGMYSKQSIPGSKANASITVHVQNIDGDFAYVVYNEADKDHIGYHDGNIPFVYCTPNLKESKKCFDSKVGEFIVNNTEPPTYPIMVGSNDRVGDKDDVADTYIVTEKGYYCVMYYNTSNTDNMTGELEIENPYGNLPADIYPYLPFYGFLGLAYLGVAIIWLILSACYWKEILQVQHYITGIIFLCMIEMTMQYAYYADYNDTGFSSPALLTIAALLNSARNSISFVALLVVCMGYGLVKPTLGTTARKVLGLGFAHFIFGTLFAASTMLQTVESQKIMALLFVFPLAVTLTLFYSWTFNSLTSTLKKLEVRRQSEKILVYKRLWRLLVLSIVILLVFLVLTIVQRYDDNYQRDNWDSLWFTTDGWIHILYFFIFVCLIFLWRPTKNNSRYGMEEVPQDEDDDDNHDVSIGNGDQVKMRSLNKKKKKGSKGSDDDDALKWVEENLSDPGEDPGPLAMEEESEEKIGRREMAKMN